MNGPTRTAPLPARVYVYAVSVSLLALILAPAAQTSAGISGRSNAVPEAVLLIALIAGAYYFPLHVSPQRKVNVSTAVEVAAVLLLPGLLAMGALVLGTLAGQAGRRAPLVQRLFNAAVAGVRAALGAVTFAGLSQAPPSALTEPVATVAAAVVMYASTMLLVRGVVALQRRERLLAREGLPPREMLVADAALSLTGILGALAAADHLWALALLVAPAVVVHRAVRDRLALQAQAQVTAEALSEAKSALAVREEFLSVASHELRTPLTALKAYIALMHRRMRRAAVPADVEQYVSQVDAQVDRLSDLVYELLDVSRLATGQAEIRREPVDLGRLVAQVVELERTTEPGRDIRLSVPEPAPAILADPGRLQQVLANLLDNAHKYSPEDRPIHVTVSPRRDGVAIAVRDEGVGIPEEEQAEIFQRFHRAGNIDRGIAGLGLGLYIANELVRAHDGELRVESTPGAGSTFTVILPDRAQDGQTSRLAGAE